jgi:hypothetical protein
MKKYLDKIFISTWVLIGTLILALAFWFLFGFNMASILIIISAIIIIVKFNQNKYLQAVSILIITFCIGNYIFYFITHKATAYTPHSDRTAKLVALNEDVEVATAINPDMVYIKSTILNERQNYAALNHKPLANDLKTSFETGNFDPAFKNVDTQISSFTKADSLLKKVDDFEKNRLKSEQKKDQITVRIVDKETISEKIDYTCVSENINLPSDGVESTKRLFLNIGDKFIISNHRGGKIYATLDSGEKYEVIPGVRQKNKDTGYLTFYGGNESSSFSVQVVERN